MVTAIETARYDVLYGKILSILGDVDRSKQLTIILYKISSDLGLSTEQVLKYVNKNGIKFDNQIYNMLNSMRTNSSQLGFIDQNNIPPMIMQQVV
jgi:hypothetical protein